MAARARDLRIALFAALSGLVLIAGGFTAGTLSNPEPAPLCAGHVASLER